MSDRLPRLNGGAADGAQVPPGFDHDTAVFAYPWSAFVHLYARRQRGGDYYFEATVPRAGYEGYLRCKGKQ